MPTFNSCTQCVGICIYTTLCRCDSAVCVCSAGNGQARHRLGETVGTMLTFCFVFSEMKFAVVIVVSVCVVLAMARPRLGETVGTMLTFCIVFSEMKFAVMIVLSVCVVLAMARSRLGETVSTMLTFCLVFSEMRFAVVIVLSVCVVLAMARPGLDLEKEKDTLLEERILNLIQDPIGNLPLYH